MTALVTGGTGFVGAHLVRALLREGESIRCLVRPGSDRRNLAGLPVEVVEGDITDPFAAARAVRGCDTVFHAAALYQLWVPDPAPMYRVNVGGTRTLLAAAGEAGSREAWWETIRRHSRIGLCNGFYFGQSGQAYVPALQEVRA